MSSEKAAVDAPSSDTDPQTSDLQQAEDASRGVSTPHPHLLAWSQVLMSHLAAINAPGYTNVFGFFQAYYTQSLNEPPSRIAWVGSIQGFLVLFLGAFVGRAVDAGYFWHFAISGLVLQLLGVFMSSVASQYWQLVLSQGICQGLGSGLLMTPTLVVVTTYFPPNKRALAMGCAASGAATGGVIFPLIARQLLGPLGIQWAVRIMGFIMMANAIMILALARPKPTDQSHKTGEFLALSSFRDPWFAVFGLGMFLVMLGLYFTYYYVTSFAEDVLGVSGDTSVALLLVINGLGIPGRFVPSLLSDWCTGPQNMLVIIIALTAISVYSWAGIHTLPGVWGLVVVFGIFAASFQSLVAPALASAGRDRTKIGAEMGMIFTLMSLGILAGPPIQGALISANQGHYLSAQMFSASVIMAGALLFFVARLISGGWVWKKC